MRIEEAINRVSAEHPSKKAIVFEDDSISYSELNELSNAFAQELTVMSGACSEDKILILSCNSIDCIVAFLGCFNAGFVACPANWRLAPVELSCILKREEFAFALVGSQCLDTYRAAQSISEIATPFAVIEDLVSISRKKCCGAQPVPHRQAGSGRGIQYFTSGTTGVSKGVPHTHDELVSYAECYAHISGWRSDDVYATCSNLAHLAGFSCFISLICGCTLVLFDRFEADKFVGAIRAERVTRVSLTPTLVVRLLNDRRFSPRDFAGVRKIVYGGAPFPSSQAERILKSLPCDFEVAYGSTETCCISIMTSIDCRELSPDRPNQERFGSVGRALPCVDVRIVDDKGDDLDPYAIGEILVRSPFVYKGYSGKHPRKSLTQDGFHRTGDMGYRDDEGYLFLIDRKHDMIVSGGENIYPSEVERCIAKIDGVSQVCVVGLPDSTWGEAVAAFVVSSAGASLSSDEIVSFCKSRISSFKKPQRVYFLDALPLNDNGKVDRKILKYFAIHVAREQGTCLMPIAFGEWFENEMRR